MTWTLNKQWGEARCIYALLTILAMEFFYVTMLLPIWCDSNYISCCWLSFPRQGGGGQVETDQVQHHWKGASSKNLFLSSAIHLEWVLLNSRRNETTFSLDEIIKDNQRNACGYNVAMGVLKKSPPPARLPPLIYIHISSANTCSVRRNFVQRDINYFSMV